MIGNILDNTTELYMIKYTFGEILSSRGETLCKNSSDQTVCSNQTEHNLILCNRMLFLGGMEKYHVLA